MSCCEIQSLQVGAPRPVQGLAGPPGVQPNEVDGSGIALQAGLRQADVTGPRMPVTWVALGDGALHRGADLVSALPSVADLLGPA